jgi:hypothetical protein
MSDNGLISEVFQVLEQRVCLTPNALHYTWNSPLQFNNLPARNYMTVTTTHCIVSSPSSSTFTQEKFSQKYLQYDSLGTVAQRSTMHVDIYTKRKHGRNSFIFSGN